jgi:hypothetical protein
MVPWLQNRQGVEVEEASREFAVTPGADRGPIWRCCFLCGSSRAGYHGDLIEGRGGRERQGVPWQRRHDQPAPFVSVSDERWP